MTDRLNQESLDVIAAARDSDRAPPECRARVRQGLVTKLGATGLAATLPATTTAATGTASATLFKIAVLVSLAGGVGGVAFRRITPQNATLKPAATIITQSPPAPTTSTPPAAVAEISVVEPVRPVVPQKQVVKRAEASPADLDRLADETAFLAKVRENMRAGAHREAMLDLERYQAQFPAGLLREESEATRVQLLNEQGDHQKACRLARTFLKKWPRSPHGVRIRALCERQALPTP